MKRSRLPLIAAIIELIIGVPIFGFGIFLCLGIFWGGEGAIFLVPGLPLVGLGLLPTLSGINALRRQNWRLTIAGAIVALLALILILNSKSEFK